MSGRSTAPGDPGGEFLAVVLPALDVVHNLARRMAPNPADAEELAQETLTRAWSAWAQGKVPREPRAWLATICLNAGRDRARRAAVRPLLVPLDPDTEIVAATDVAGEAITRVQRALVERALWDLPEEQRIAIVLMDLCGLTASETATITEAPRGTVLARVHRGRTRLARLLNPDPPQPRPNETRPNEDDEEVTGRDPRP